ncbi:SOS response-associated protein YedK [Pleomorphomonas sp. T1.2MG-36]|uniref:SOS response-associated peptidase n=1 Tax=Pleomorphomonas sp. T1.2MG-36 TaxID=3041167 RepID=UPI00247794B8|nr:SOS response-associated peptidase [Pleomorphomonas sp. T1.2MG-36]CAI9407919.1 SOS response-associated protein YedK [Pleomorphomonas sp. T1.2MG-36]
MCGRFVLIESLRMMQNLFGYRLPEEYDKRILDMGNRYNIAPTQPIAVIDAGLDGVRHVRLVRWGLIPAWTKDAKTQSLLFNARSETAADKPSFRTAMRHRRCLIPASGFYEWRRMGTAKMPYYIRPRDGSTMAFAGLTETWLGSDGSEIDTGAILTTGANRLMAMLHDRMPVVLDPKDWDEWLDCGNRRPRDVAHLLKSAADDLLEAIPVSERANSVGNDDEALIAPLAEPLTVDREPSRKKADPAPDDEPPAQGSLF